MKKILSSIIKGSIISSVILVALGLLLIFKSEVTIITISYIIGALLIAMGVLTELNYLKENKDNLAKGDLDIIYGIVCAILGIVVIKNPEAIASIIPLAVGVIIVANSVVKLQYSLELKKEKNDLWISTLILSIVMVICGIVLIFNPFTGAVLFTKIVGIFILIYAVLDLVSTFFIKKTLDKIHEEVKSSLEDVKEALIVEEKEPKKLEIKDEKEEDKKDEDEDKKSDEKE